jgi:hypothetical protein
MRTTLPQNLFRRQVPVSLGDLDPFEYDHEQLAGHFLPYRLQDIRQVFHTSDAETRFSHTVCVMRVASAVAKALGLNVNLATAIALAHDIAHCPFGHLGESVLSHYLHEIGKEDYDHVRVAPYVLQEVGKLNLTFGVVEGVTYHGLSSGVMSRDVPSEYRVVALADKSYVFGDSYDLVNILADIYRLGKIDIAPDEILQLRNRVGLASMWFGKTLRKRIEWYTQAIIDESREVGEVSFSKSQNAKDFEDFRQMQATEVWTKTDLPEDKLLLERVLERLLGSDMPVNPYLFFALLQDSELSYIDSLPRGRLKWESLRFLQVYDLPLPSRYDFSFLTPDLSWGST